MERLFGQQKWFAGLLLYTAHIILIIDIFRLRLEQVNGQWGNLISPLTIVLLLGAALIIAVTVWLAYTGRVQRFIGSLTWAERAGLLVLVIGVSLVIIALGWGADIRSLNFAYVARMLAIWLALLNLWLLLVILTTPRTTTAAVTLWQFVKFLLLLAVVLLLMEGGLRFWLVNFATRDTYLTYMGSVEEVRQEAVQLTGLPYLNYGLQPDFESRQHNSMGFRGPEIETPKPDGVFRIVSLGASGVYGLYTGAYENSYPAQLEKILHEEYGYDQVEVINAGVQRYSSWEAVVDFAFHVLDTEPDLIVPYLAYVDMMHRMVDPADYTGLNPGQGIWQDNPQPYSPIVLLRYLTLEQGWREPPYDGYSRLAHPVHTAPCYLDATGDTCTNLGMSSAELLAANPPIYFERNMQNLIALAKANDVAVLLSTWAYSDEFGMYYEYQRPAIDEHNQVLQKLATTMNIPIIDLHAMMTDNSDYWADRAHFNIEGAKQQAALYAAFLVEEGLLPPLED